MALATSTLHRTGQKLYQNGDFTAAIDAFSEVDLLSLILTQNGSRLPRQALKEKKVDSVGVLDNRAATYCKLGKYDQARRDARHMIKKSKEDERVRTFIKYTLHALF